MATYLTPNFTVEEFLCPCGDCGGGMISIDLVMVLQDLRDQVGRPIYISEGGGVRCSVYNASLRLSSPRSQHLNAKAADITIEGLDVVTTWRICLLEPRFTGLGYYLTHTHVDIRPGPRVFWSSR